MRYAVADTAQLQICLELLDAGDPAALDALIRLAHGRLRRLARKMLRGRPDLRRWEQTDDVLQNALLRLYRALQEVKPVSVRHFLRLAALQIRRELLDLGRHYFGPEGPGAHHATNAGDATGPPRYDKPDAANDPRRLVEWVEFHQQVEQLPEEEREVLDLLFYHDLTQREAAVMLGVTERTVQNRYARALTKLHRVLKDNRPGS
jgi:RNA polymerase sigma-70 factor (ECF subfamily)